MSRPHLITDRDPEDTVAWEAANKKIARRNLTWSVAQAALYSAQIAFIGPLLGSIARVYGGRLADRIGGGPITLVTFERDDLGGQPSHRRQHHR